MTTKVAITTPSAPRPETDVSSENIEEILGIHKSLKMLRPEMEVKADILFEKLVHICSKNLDESISDRIMLDPRIVSIEEDLRRRFSDAEGRLEKKWAAQICHRMTEHEQDVGDELRGYPYYNDYRALTKAELGSILTNTADYPPRKFAFIGSGSMPLTSICIADALDVAKYAHLPPLKICNIDRDAAAIELSKELTAKLGARGKSLWFECDDAAGSGADLTPYDVVYLAALVGGSQTNKRWIIGDVVRRMRPGALLVMRSAHSLRRLLYPAVGIDPVDLGKIGLESFLFLSPRDQMVNFVLVARVLK